MAGAMGRKGRGEGVTAGVHIAAEFFIYSTSSLKLRIMRKRRAINEKWRVFTRPPLLRGQEGWRGDCYRSPKENRKTHLTALSGLSAFPPGL